MLLKYAEHGRTVDIEAVQPLKRLGDHHPVEVLHVEQLENNLLEHIARLRERWRLGGVCDRGLVGDAVVAA